ncbi:hypothetical protein, partial [Mycobacterium canetti]
IPTNKSLRLQGIAFLLPEHKDFGRIAPDEKTDAGE